MTARGPFLAAIRRLAHADWLDRKRIIAWGAILLAVEAAFLLLCAPLALLPYLAAFYAFQVVSLTAWLMMIRRVLGARGVA